MPLALGIGEGGEQNAPLGRVVVGGLIFGIALFRALAPLIPRRYRGIQAEKVARALIRKANEGGRGAEIVESDRLQDF